MTLSIVENFTLQPHALWMTLAACLVLCPMVLCFAERLARPYEAQREIKTGSRAANVIACVLLIIALFLITQKYSNLISLGLMQVFIATLTMLALIDLRLKVLPNKVTIPLLIIGLCLSLTGYTISWQDALLGATAGFLMLFIPEIIFLLLTGRTGVGFGDVKLMAGVGAWIGWHSSAHPDHCCIERCGGGFYLSQGQKA
ncbi:prepilin peptidase [Orrella sp. 11846]|uniref:prepilin peptidase n=1 Tax=Orrella sp. 11846 TaxID=3409913 RepID=UPI003B5A8D57